MISCEKSLFWMFVGHHSKPLLDQFGRAQQRARLGFGFFPLQLGHRVGDHAGRRLHVQHLVLHDAGADRDRHVHVAGVADVAAGAAVQAALGRLELVDEFHRVHLGRAGQRAGREGGLEHVDGGHAVLQRAFDVAHDVHHVAVALDREGLGHLHACRSWRCGRCRCAPGRSASRARRAPSGRSPVPPRPPCRVRARRRAGACRPAGGW